MQRNEQLLNPCRLLSQTLPHPLNMEMEMGYTGMVLGSLLVIIATKLCHAFYNLIWKPYKITKSLEKQGLRGPPYKFPHGSTKQINDFQAAADGLVMDSRSHDISSKLLPHYHAWSSLYGMCVYMCVFVLLSIITNNNKRHCCLLLQLAKQAELFCTGWERSQGFAWVTLRW